MPLFASCLLLLLSILVKHALDLFRCDTSSRQHSKREGGSEGGVTRERIKPENRGNTRRNSQNIRKSAGFEKHKKQGATSHTADVERGEGGEGGGRVCNEASETERERQKRTKKKREEPMKQERITDAKAKKISQSPL